MVRWCCVYLRTRERERLRGVGTREKEDQVRVQCSREGLAYVSKWPYEDMFCVHLCGSCSVSRQPLLIFLAYGHFSGGVILQQLWTAFCS